MSIDNYLYCTTHANMNALISDIRRIINTSPKPCIFLDCEGRDLGSSSGKLSLIQLGVGDSIYLVDVIIFSEAVALLKEYLEDPNLIKYVWDGRSDYSELRHGHGVTLKGLIDLQLVYLYSTGDALASRRAIWLSGMVSAAEKLNALTEDELSQIRSGISFHHNLKSDSRSGRSQRSSSQQKYRNLALTSLAELFVRLRILRCPSLKSSPHEAKSTYQASGKANSRRITPICRAPSPFEE